MKLYSALAPVLLALAPSVVRGQDLDQVRKMEASGDVAGARAELAHAADGSPHNVAALSNYAEFLQRYGDPACKGAYTKLLAALRESGDTARAAVIAKRLALLELVAGDAPASAFKDSSPSVPIPGPLRSFARMAAISGDSSSSDILPALARNVVTNGYQASHSNEALEQTEYLKLVHRYLSQARELEKLAGDSKVIKIENCDSPTVGELLRILGFRMRGGCGSEVVLETVNAARAFLTTDSGFPMNELEQALRTNRPFTYDYHPARARCCSARSTGPAAPRTKLRRFHRVLHLRPVALPSVPGLFQAGPRNRRGSAQRHLVHAPQSLRARARFLRRHVRNPRRQGRGARRPALGRRFGAIWSAPRPTRAPSSSTS